MLKFFGFMVALLGIVGSANAALLEYNFTSSANASTVGDKVVSPSAYQGFGNQQGQQFTNATFGNTPTNTGYQIGAGRWSTWNAGNTNKQRTINNVIDNTPPFTDYSGFNFQVSDFVQLDRLELNFRSDAAPTRALNFQVYYQVNSNTAVRILDRSQNDFTPPADPEDGFGVFGWVSNSTETNEFVNLGGLILTPGDTFRIFVVGSNPGAAGANLPAPGDGVTQLATSRSYDLGFIRLTEIETVVPEPTSMALFVSLVGLPIARKFGRKR